MKKKFIPPSAEHRRKYAERAAARSNEAQRAASVKVTLPKLSFIDEAAPVPESSWNKLEPKHGP